MRWERWVLTFGLYLPNLRRIITCQRTKGINSIGQHERDPKAFSIRDHCLQRWIMMYILVHISTKKDTVTKHSRPIYRPRREHASLRSLM